MMHSLVVLIGRTACGKTTLAKRLSSALIPCISVGELIRTKAEQCGRVRAQYGRNEIFEESLIARLLRARLLELNSASIIVEGSIGLGEALNLLREEGWVERTATFVIDCPRDIRLDRFILRRAAAVRTEEIPFFDGRERLFDAHLPATIDVLRRMGTLHVLDGAAPIDQSLHSLREHLASDIFGFGRSTPHSAAAKGE